MRLTALIYALLIFPALSHVAGIFEGHWLYSQSCSWQHGVEFCLTLNSQSVVGTWSDGHRSKVWEGELKGTVRGSKLFE